MQAVCDKLLLADLFAVAGISPMLFPVLFLSVLVLSALVLVGRKLCQEVDQPIDPLAAGRRPALNHVLLVVLLAIGFIYATPAAGFVLITAVTLFLLLWSFGAGWKTGIVLASAVPALLYYLFAHSLGAPLPRGWLGW